MKILAAIVTHNRRDLLARCLDGVSTQRRPADDVLVIDNDSSDGTPEMLQGRGVRSIRQANVGSAGGWHRAIEVAGEGGFDAVWLMDDDGYPEAEALGLLEKELSANIAACASSVVLCEDDTSRFVFPFPVLDQKGLPKVFGLWKKRRTLDSLRSIAPDGTYPFAHLFNGALISMAAVEKVGNVNRDYFIFGDEVDFFFRLRDAGPVVSVLDAKHFHPDVTARPYTPAKIYYYTKNTIILNHRYFNVPLVRDAIALVAALSRTWKRNGAWEALSYIVGRNFRVLPRAIARGVAGKIGKDFDA